jgi:hypothetical protein
MSPNGGLDFDLCSCEKIILDSKVSKIAVRQILFLEGWSIIFISAYFSRLVGQSEAL